MEASKSIPFPSKGSRRGSKEKGRGWSRSAQRDDQAGTYHTLTPGTCNEWGWKHPWEPNQHSQLNLGMPAINSTGNPIYLPCPGRHSSFCMVPIWRWDASASPMAPLVVICITVEGP